jgi:hypothetical protein
MRATNVYTFFTLLRLRDHISAVRQIRLVCYRHVKTDLQCRCSARTAYVLGMRRRQSNRYAGTLATSNVHAEGKAERCSNRNDAANRSSNRNDAANRSSNGNDASHRRSYSNANADTGRTGDQPHPVADFHP